MRENCELLHTLLGVMSIRCYFLRVTNYFLRQLACKCFVNKHLFFSIPRLISVAPFLWRLTSPLFQCNVKLVSVQHCVYVCIDNDWVTSGNSSCCVGVFSWDSRVSNSEVKDLSLIPDSIMIASRTIDYFMSAGIKSNIDFKLPIKDSRAIFRVCWSSRCNFQEVLYFANMWWKYSR